MTQFETSTEQVQPSPVSAGLDESTDERVKAEQNQAVAEATAVVSPDPVELQRKKWREAKRRQAEKKRKAEAERRRRRQQRIERILVEEQAQTDPGQKTKTRGPRKRDYDQKRNEQLKKRVGQLLGKPTKPPLDDKEVERLTKRIDKGIPHTQLSPEFKQAIRNAYQENLKLNFSELAKATGVGYGSVVRAVEESPGLTERVRRLRSIDAIEDMDRGIAAMLRHFRESAEAGKIRLDKDTLKSWAILFGTMVDKRQLLTGRSTTNVEIRAHLTIEQRKERMLEVLQRAKDTVKYLGQDGNNARP